MEVVSGGFLTEMFAAPAALQPERSPVTIRLRGGKTEQCRQGTNVGIVEIAYEQRRAVIALGMLPPPVRDWEIDYTARSLTVPKSCPGGAQ